MGEAPLRVSPAEYVISVFGGVRKVARAIGRDPASVSRWRRAAGQKGTDGRIPSKAQQELLAKAQALGLDLTPDDLLLGREV